MINIIEHEGNIICDPMEIDSTFNMFSANVGLDLATRIPVAEVQFVIVASSVSS